MRLGIKYKLFLILLAASLTIIGFMLFFTRISFKRGFVQYMDKVHQNNMAMMSQELADIYVLYDGWDKFKENPEIWGSVQDYAFRKWHHSRKDRPFHRPLQRLNPNQPHNDYPNGRKKNRPQFYLLDQDKHPVFATSDERVPNQLYPVTVDGKDVGYVGLLHPRSVIQAEELRFFKQQSRIFIMIALGMVIISVIVAVWTAIYLERPIRVVTKGMRELASGRFKTRISVKSKDELGLLATDFNILAQTLEENEKDRKKWVEDIAHELRTPLTLLSGELEAVEDGVRDLTPDTIARLREDIQHLVSLVSDLNELSRTDKGALAYKKKDVNLGHLLADVLGRYEKALSEQNLDIDFSTVESGTLVVFADPERLKQLFTNIFENILNYTQKGGEVRVRVKRPKDHIIITIEDSGPGVPKEALSMLFGRLYRVEGSRNRRFGGSGLGLSICKNIVDAHHGDISAFSSDLGGLGIKIQLPLNDKPVIDTSFT